MYFRLVNLLEIAKLDLENIWKIIKKIRKLYLSNHPHQYCSIDSSRKMLPDILSNINSLEAELKLNATYIPNVNVSYKTLQTSAEIFTYLNFCPTQFLSFMTLLIKTGSPKEIILALTKIIKNSKNDATKTRTIKIFTKIMSGLNHISYYERLQMITKGKGFTNSTIDPGKKENKLFNPFQGGTR